MRYHVVIQASSGIVTTQERMNKELSKLPVNLSTT